MRKSWLLHAISLASTLFFLLLQFFNPAVLDEYIEGKSLDIRLFTRNALEASPPPADMLIVTVDEKSIAEIGRWPWNRPVMAQLLSKIGEGRPRVTGIDILFSEEESEERDDQLAAALGKMGEVVLAASFLVPQDTACHEQGPEVDYLWDHAFQVVNGTTKIPWEQWVVKADNVLLPLEKFAANAGLGHVYTLSDRDGVLRRDILYLKYLEDYYPSFALQVARLALGISNEQMAIQAGDGVLLGERFIPADLNGRVYIKYRGREGSFQYVSASDVIKNRIEPDIFTDKTVLVGTSALACYDQKVTPLSGNMPGVEKNANVVDNIINGPLIQSSPGIIELVVTMLSALLLSILLCRMKALGGALLAFLSVSLYIGLCFYLFAFRDIALNLIYPTSNMFCIFLIHTLTKFVFEERKARQIRSIFSRYVSPKVVEELVNNPEKARLGGERREVTVLFSDIRGFTSMSERLQPEEVVSSLNEYFKVMTDIIFKYEGTLDKFVGDAIMAFWGAPVAQPRHAELAVRCAVEMIVELRKIQEIWLAEGKPLLDCGIGLNTGEVLVGNIGAEDKMMDYTIIGDHVNTGARVESLTKDYEAKILITGNTRQQIGHLLENNNLPGVELIAREPAKVKGKAVALEIYEVKVLPGESC